MGEGPKGRFAGGARARRGMGEGPKGRFVGGARARRDMGEGPKGRFAGGVRARRDRGAGFAAAATSGRRVLTCLPSLESTTSEHRDIAARARRAAACGRMDWPLRLGVLSTAERVIGVRGVSRCESRGSIQLTAGSLRQRARPRLHARSFAQAVLRCVRTSSQA